MKLLSNRLWALVGTLVVIAIVLGVTYAQEPKQKETSYAPVDI